MRKALIVDDYEENLYLLRQYLLNHGFEVTMAQNGKEALIAAHQDRPDIIISDILMPVMDGFALCAEWQRDPALRSVPFVFYSATYTAKSDQELALKLGAACYIHKPKEIHEFMQIIEQVLAEFSQGQLTAATVSDNGPDSENYRLYNAALIRKLEKKMLELEVAHQELALENEERLKAQAQLRLHARVFAEAHEGILILDGDFRILSTNRSLSQMTGYPESEFLGQPPFLFSSGPYDASFFSGIRATMEGSGVWQGEIWVRTKAGSTQPMWMKATAHDGSGERTYIVMLLDLSEQKTQAAHIEKLAFYDGLTGLPNRALLLDRLEQSLMEAARRGQPLSVFFINLDRFREINESQGHAAGDLVLQEVTRRFSGCLPEGGLIARFGADDFVAVVQGVDQAAAHFIAGKLTDSLLTAVPIGELKQNVRARIGISVYPTDGHAAEDLIRQADIAMHRTRETKMPYLFFQSEMSQETNRRIQLVSRLSEALHRGQLELYFQPQVELAGGKLVGVETLLRWKDAEWGWISPAEFIPLAESRGLIVPIGYWVLEETCRNAVKWLDSGLELPGRISINVSAYQLDDNITGGFSGLCQKASLDPGLFELELTESAAMADPEHSARILDGLRNAGFTLAIDDFGVAYSSLVYLKRFAADKLKIDMSFVRGILHSASDRAIVTTIIGMARSLGMSTLAEGVEDRAQSELLRDLNCDAAQGYFFARPLPADELAQTWLAQKA